MAIFTEGVKIAIFLYSKRKKVLKNKNWDGFCFYDCVILTVPT